MEHGQEHGHSVYTESKTTTENMTNDSFFWEIITFL
jgi:hypothetical protein